MKKRSNLNIMLRLIGLVKPLTGFMILAILMGLIGHLCASFITIFGGYAVLLSGGRAGVCGTYDALCLRGAFRGGAGDFCGTRSRPAIISSPSNCWR